MLRFFLFALVLLLGLNIGPAQAQAPAAPPVAATGSLTGQVLDSLQQAPVPYATVVLLPADAANNTPITGVAADGDGRFAMVKLAPGAFRLRVSYVGFGTQTRAVTVTAGPTAVPAFRLPPAATALAEAVVIGSKPIVVVRPDRLIYNAAQDVTNAGGTAADVLRKAPLLAVDGDGNVTMRGSSNFRVLINNKPAPTLANNLAQALKGIPAESIENIEIITTPPAKYDGEGTAGIINIVLKKGVSQAPNGRLGAGGGNRNSSADASFNFRQGKVGFTSSGGTGWWYNPGADERSRTTRDAATGAALTQLEQRSDNYNKGQYVYGAAGLDFDPAPHHSLSLAGSLNGYKGSTTNDLGNDFRTLSTGASQQFARSSSNRFQALVGDLTGTYTRTFAQARREWSLLGQAASNGATTGYDFNQFAGTLAPLDAGRASYRERARNVAPGREYTVQTDFVQPFGEKRTLEVGLKSIWRRSGSVADIDADDTALGQGFVRVPGRATDFTYDQDVQAAYATYGFAVGKKITASLGGRLERTALAADFRAAAAAGFSRAYLSPLPNGSAQYSFSETTSLRAAYSRRITRPNIYFLNPFRDRSDPSTVSFGNPGLDPELTDSYELAYNTGFKTTTLNASLSVLRTGNAIEQIRLPTLETGVTEQTFANVASNAFYQFSLYGSVKPTPKWDVSGGPNVLYIVRRSPALGADNRGFQADINLNTSYKFTKEFSVQAFVMGSLPHPEIQGTGPANLYYDFGAKKSFLKDRLDLTVNLSNPFNATWAYRGTTNTPTFAEQSAYIAFQRAWRVYLGYRFGKESGGRQRKSIRNDDQKSGGSKQGG